MKKKEWDKFWKNFDLKGKEFEEIFFLENPELDKR